MLAREYTYTLAISIVIWENNSDVEQKRRFSIVAAPNNF